jgi:hypothetical protein
MTHQQVCDAIRGVTAGAVTFIGASVETLDQYVSQLVDLDFLTWRAEYRTEPMDASTWEKLQRKMNIRTNAPPERRFVVFWYQRRPLSEVPVVESGRRAVEEVKAAIKKQHDDEDARLDAALRRRGLTLTTTAQEA